MATSHSCANQKRNEETEVTRVKKEIDNGMDSLERELTRLKAGPCAVKNIKYCIQGLYV